VKQANIEKVENGFVVNIFTSGDGCTTKRYIAGDAFDVGELIKKHLNERESEERQGKKPKRNLAA